LGVSVVPRSTARILTEEVCYRPIEGDAPRAAISLAHCSNGNSRAVQNFVAVARHVIRGEAENESKDNSKEPAKASA
jgi:DNA-binding transcriptional LysR family regulator